MLGALLAVQGTVDSRALQPSPGPLAHGPRQSPAPLKRPAHADVKEPRVKPSRADSTDTAAEQHWTLNHRASGCPSGRRNAEAHECLNAVQEAVVGIYVVAGFKVLTNFENAKEDGWSSSIPAGCSYSNVTQRAIFNHNQSNSNFHNVKDNYRHVCTNDEQKATSFTAAPKAKPRAQLKAKPSAELKAKLESAAKKSAAQEKAEPKAEPKKSDHQEKETAGVLSAADIGKFVSGNPQSHEFVDSFKSEGGPFPQFVCDTDTSVLETCPNLVASRGGPGPNLKVPASSRLLFAGPDHLMEVYAAVLAANGGCASRINGTVCVLSNGAKMAFLRSLGEEETDALAASLALTHWTHGFFMQPHGPPYQGEHVGERYWQLRAALAKKREDQTGPDMCLPMSVKDGTPADSKTGFAAYRKCINSKPQLLRFRRLLRGADRTLAVPWHVAPPPDHESLQHTYFTRPWAVMLDCRPDLRPRPEASRAAGGAGVASSSSFLYEYANGDVFAGEQSDDQAAEASLAAELESASFLSASPTPSRAARASPAPAPSAKGKGSSKGSKAAAAAASAHAASRPSPLPSPSPSAAGKGAKAKSPTSFFRSLAKRNPHGVRPEGKIFNPMDSQIMTDLQCVTVCEPAGEGQSCYHGPVTWMAHDLLALAK
jgi:hypothetical protein